MPEVLSLSAAGSCFSFMNGVISAYLVEYCLSNGIEKSSLYFTAYSVILFLVRPFSGRLMDRYGLDRVMYPGTIIAALSMAVLSGARSLPVLLAAAALRAIGQGAVHPSLQAACVKKAGAAKTGVANSTFYLGGDVGQGFGPIVGGFVVGSFGHRAIFLTGAALLLAGLVLYRLTEGKSRDNTAGE